MPNSIETAVNTWAAPTDPGSVGDGEGGNLNAEDVVTVVMAKVHAANEKTLNMNIKSMDENQDQLDSINNEMAFWNSTTARVTSPDAQQGADYRNAMARINELKGQAESMGSISQEQLTKTQLAVSHLTQGDETWSATVKKINDAKDAIIGKIG